MTCAICGQEGKQHYCLGCIIKYAVQAGANRKKLIQLLAKDLSEALQNSVVGYVDDK